MTRHLPASPIGRGDPIVTRVDSKMLQPGIRDFRVHDMNVTIRLNLLGWQSATFNIDLDMGKLGDDTRRGAPLTLRASGSRGAG
jgi:hypothetical protein